MRFRKSVSLGGLGKVNFSKSGVSLTVGGKGMSTTFGKKGTYVNYGIPGTGIYNRKKVSGGKTTSQRSGVSSIQGEPVYEPLNVPSKPIEMIFLEDGTVIFKEENGNPITDQRVINRLKNSDEVKAQIAELSKTRMEMYNDDIDKIINVQKLSDEVYSFDAYSSKIVELKRQGYTPKTFFVPKPTIEDVVADLAREAETTITAKFGKAKLIQRYIDETKDQEYENRLKQWIDEKRQFEKEEEASAAEYDENILLMERIANKDREATDIAITQWLSTIQFPFDFNVEFAFVEGKDILFVDLDLPEIEDMMTKKAQQMANGIVKMKEKSQKEIKADYSTCVFGLAVYFASNLFNIAAFVPHIIISGYTQRRNSKGDVQDDYIYSILFDREKFIGMDYINTDPKTNCMKYKNRCNQYADLGFKAIEPYGQTNE